MRHMNRRLVRKTLSYSKRVKILKATCAWDDWAYNLTRPVKTLRLDVNHGQRRWQQRTPAMAADLTDHIWTVKELLMRVVPPIAINSF